MYESFYGLAERPFDLTPNPRFLYITPRQREALANLRYGLTTPRGLTLLLGEAGAGKTTLLQATLAELAATQHQVVIISNPTLTRNEFYQHLAQAFQLSASAAESKTHFLFELRRELVEREKMGRCTAVVLDEAQSAPYHLLEEVRLLGNLETPTTKLLNVVLSGQPELAERLNEPSLRQLKQRVSLRCELGPFDLRNTASYIAGRLKIAGGNAAEVFTQKAVIEIFEFSRGLPRTINVIADNALIGGFAAQVKPVTAAIVQEVCADFDIRQPAESNGNGNGHQPDVPVGAEMAVSGGAEESVLRPAQTDGSAPLFNTFTRKRRFDFFS
jgi:type II secretory pathway predicted ATPase ExeA